MCLIKQDGFVAYTHITNRLVATYKSTKLTSKWVAVQPGLWTLDWTGLDWTGLDRKFDDHFLQFLMYMQVHGQSIDDQLSIKYSVWSHRP